MSMSNSRANTVRRLSRSTAVLLVLAFCAQPLLAEDAEKAPPPLKFAEELGKHRMPIVQGATRLEGEGARFLADAAAHAEFFLVGEDHGIADTPQFVESMFPMLHDAGYRYFAAEIGPSGAKTVVDLARSKQPDAAFAGYLRVNPFALPFFNWAEEGRLAESVTNGTPVQIAQPDPIWGLDQEFIMSAKPNISRLFELAPDAAARKVVGEYKDKTDKEFDVMVSTGNPASVFFATATDDDFSRMRKAMHPKTGDEADVLLSELQQSAAIYQLNFKGQGYRSNTDRAALMKRHFMDHYRKAIARDHAPPHVLFKFGTYHVKRGKSFVDVYDIGNLAQELAASNGMRSFHLFVIALDGTQNAYRPFGGDVADKTKAIDAAEAYDFLDLTSIVEAAKAPAANGAAPGWQVFDLEAMRADVAAGKYGTLGKGIEELVFGYDAILVMRNVHAAKFYE